MSRRRPAETRKILPDPRFNDLFIAKFCNVFMKGATKGRHRKILYRSMAENCTREKETPPLEIVKAAVDHIKPTVEVKSRRVGGSTYQVPVEVRHQRRAALAIRWIIQQAQARNGKTMESKLANELLDAFNNRGGAVRKKEDVHRMADANKAFAHYRW